MNEAITAAEQLFREQRAKQAEAGTSRRPVFGRTWMEAILGAGLVAASGFIAISLAPDFMTTTQPGTDALPREAFRTDVRQTPDMRPAGLDLIVPLEPITFGDLRLGVRNVDDRYGVYRIDENGLEQTLLTGDKAPGEAISVTDAALTDWNGRQVLSIRSGFGDLQRWDAFVRDEFGFTRSTSLSRMIWDAVDAQDVGDRLASTPETSD